MDISDGILAATVLEHSPECYQNILKQVPSKVRASYSAMRAWLREYHAARNPFERFRGFLELISRFEFEFCRCANYFFEGSEFLVRSCECAVACLCPRNSISNVVASLTIDDNIYIYVRCVYM